MGAEQGSTAGSGIDHWSWPWHFAEQVVREGGRGGVGWGDLGPPSETGGLLLYTSTRRELVERWKGRGESTRAVRPCTRQQRKSACVREDYGFFP